MTRWRGGALLLALVPVAVGLSSCRRARKVVEPPPAPAKVHVPPPTEVPAGRSFVVAAAGDIAGRSNRHLETAALLLELHEKRAAGGDPAAGGSGLPARRVPRLPRLLPPQLGSPGAAPAHPPGARQPRIRSGPLGRARLLRLLERTGRRVRPGRPARAGLLQLRAGRLAPDRREHQRRLPQDPLRGGIGHAHLAGERPARDHQEVRAGLLAPPALPGGQRPQVERGGGADLGCAVRGAAPTWC